eukprot:m.200603 g.200603  ORF g.200603 m.200603 type:complete len:248 (-) comp10665_c0_seq21:776-1519(-)
MRTKLLVSTVVVALMAAAAIFPEKLLPLKTRVAVELLGWRGLFRVVGENIAYRSLGPKTTAAREEFHLLLQTLAQADLDYLSPEAGIVTEDDIAEGQLLALQLLHCGLHLYMYSGPTRPEMRRLLTSDRKFMGDNPDVVYFASALDPGLEYEITGKRSGEAFMSIAVYSSDEMGGFATGTAGELSNKQLSYDGDSYRIILSRKRPTDPAVNWIDLGETGALFVCTDMAPLWHEGMLRARCVAAQATR